MKDGEAEDGGVERAKRRMVEGRMTKGRMVGGRMAKGRMVEGRMAKGGWRREDDEGRMAKGGWWKGKGKSFNTKTYPAFITAHTRLLHSL